MTRISATEAARNFSDVLNRVAGGEQIEIRRSGVVVAVLSPPRMRFLSAQRFRDLLESAPPIDTGFAADVKRLRTSVGAPEDVWPS